jgi:hypothetical protein
MNLRMVRRISPLLAAIVLAGCAGFPVGTWTGRAQVPAAAAPAAPPPSPAIERRSRALVMGRCHDVRGEICYQDAEGKTQYWTYSGKAYSAEVKERQQRYNIWVSGVRSGVLAISPHLYTISLVEAPLPYRYYSPPKRTLAGNYITMPESIRETGRLDQDTIAIPLYRGVLRLLIAARDFMVDCERDYARDYDSKRLCGRLLQPDRYEEPPSAQELQRFDPMFRLRMVALQQAFAKSAQLARSLGAVLGSSGMVSEDLIVQGIDPDQLSVDGLRAMEDADAALTATLDEVDWTANAYRRNAGNGSFGAER